MIQQQKLLFTVYLIIGLSLDNASTARHPNGRHGRVRNLILKNTCRKGTYYDAAKSHCVACLCDTIGSKNIACDLNNGQCFCKMGYNGKKCSSCIAGYYRDALRRTCAPCNCNKDGSKSIECAPTGQCRCKNNIGGKKCNRCLDFRKECTENCPEMYDVVGEEFEKFQKKLEKMQLVLNSIGLEKSRMDELTSKINELKQEVRKKLVDWDDQGDVLGLFKMVNDLRDQVRSYTRRAEDLNELQSVTKQILGELARIDDIIKSSRKTCVETCKKAASYKDNRDRFLQKLNEIQANYKDASSRVTLLVHGADDSKSQGQVAARRSNQVHGDAENFTVPKDAGYIVFLPLETDRISAIFQQLDEMGGDLEEVQNLYEGTRKLQTEYAVLTVKAIQDYLDKCISDVENRTKTTLQNLQSYEYQLGNVSLLSPNNQSNITDIKRIIDHNYDELEEFNVLAKKFIEDDDQTREVFKNIFGLMENINVTVIEDAKLLGDTKENLAGQEANFDKRLAEAEKKMNQAIKEVEKKTAVLEEDIADIEMNLSGIEKDVETLMDVLKRLETRRFLFEELTRLKAIKEELDKINNSTSCTIRVV